MVFAKFDGDVRTIEPAVFAFDCRHGRRNGRVTLNVDFDYV